MAITWAVTINKTHDFGDQVIKDVTLTATGTYTTGGDSVTAAALGLDVIDFMEVMVDGNGANTNGTALVSPNLATAGSAKLQLWGANGAAAGVATFVEIPAATTMTGLTLHCLVYGV